MKAAAAVPRDAKDVLLGVALAGALLLLTLTTTGGAIGSADAANTWSQILLTGAAACTGLAVMFIGGRGPAWGVRALLWFAALAVLTYASIGWSAQPAWSWLEANRALSYLAAFAIGIVLARLSPGRWRAMIFAVAIYTLLISGYALLAKAFPETLDANGTLARLNAPFGYENAVGVVAAMGVPAWLWLGAERRTRPSVTAVSVMALGLLVSAMLLAYGRGALVAVVVGTALWIWLIPLRLRATLLLALGVAGGGAIAAWESTKTSLIRDYTPLAARTLAGHEFGQTVLIAAIALLAAGAVSAVAFRRVRLTPAVKRRIGTALIALLALVPGAAVASLATSSRGFGGEVSHIWSSLTTTKGVNNAPGRIGQLASSRPGYWRDGLDVGEHAPLLGTGALGFAVAHLRYSANSGQGIVQAHSYVLETFADLGVVGLVLSGGLLVAWGRAVRRTLADTSGPRAAGSGTRAAGTRAIPDPDPTGVERVGALTLLATVVIFGVHSAVDWTWFIPGAAIPPLLCAGWLAGRGPLHEQIGMLPKARSPLDQPLLGGVALLLVTVTLAFAWVIWLPLRSSNANGTVVAALNNGDGGKALTAAHTAVSADPVDWEPLRYLSTVYAWLGHMGAARKALVDATSLQPSNPETWLALAHYDRLHHHPQAAQHELAHARSLEPYIKDLGP